MSTHEWVTFYLEQLLDLDEGALTGDTNLSDCGNWDSVNQMRILVQLETRLGASLDFDRFMSVVKCGDLVDLVDDASTQHASVRGTS